MAEALGELLTLQRKLHSPAIAEHPDVEDARRLLQEKIEQAVTRIVPQHLLSMERTHGWSASFAKSLEAYERFGLFTGDEKAENALMSPKEVRNAAPSIGSVIDALKAHPELLAKVEQGFTKVHPVPFGLSPTALKEAMGKAIAQYHGAGKLRSSDGTKLKLDAREPVWMWDGYKDADTNGSLVYSPERFDPQNHGGKTKKEILAASQFPGWQVLLLENMRDIPREGNGQVVGGRKQIEANHTPHEYLELLRAEGHALEQGLTPEAWQALFLTRLAETDGEVLDDYSSGAACYCTGAYFPASGDVPDACWRRGGGQARVGRSGARCRFSVVGSRAGVRVS
ncbi:MAG: hypothetical protein PHO20_00615 [Candidatus Peribacteraceae bacterium]|nr:hypothetical protein [Candidatus Peribacteraceae bacterium]MDD5739254.1 hypothetical protein [Candidatus Peribacteraceae bacterium]